MSLPTFSCVDEKVIDEELTCIICFYPLQNPLTHVKCGTSLCQNCIEKCEYKCPVCREGTSNDYSQVRALMGQSARIRVVCSSCKSQMNLGDFDHHKRKCPTPCERLCGISISSLELKQHDEVCARLPVPCTASDLGCKAVVLRCDLKIHTRTCKHEIARAILKPLKEDKYKLEELQKAQLASQRQLQKKVHDLDEERKRLLQKESQRNKERESDGCFCIQMCSDEEYNNKTGATMCLVFTFIVGMICPPIGVLLIPRMHCSQKIVMCIVTTMILIPFLLPAWATFWYLFFLPEKVDGDDPQCSDFMLLLSPPIVCLRKGKALKFSIFCIALMTMLGHFPGIIAAICYCCA